MDLFNVPQYLTLCQSSAYMPDINTYEWDIPNSYYNNNRGNTCYISLVDASFDSDEELSCVFRLKTPSCENVICTQNNGGKFLGLVPYFSGTNKATTYTYYKTDSVKLLINDARPSKIVVESVDPNGNFFELTNLVLILKLDYVNTQETKNGILGTYYKTI